MEARSKWQGRKLSPFTSVYVRLCRTKTGISGEMVRILSVEAHFKLPVALAAEIQTLKR